MTPAPAISWADGERITPHRIDLKGTPVAWCEQSYAFGPGSKDRTYGEIDRFAALMSVWLARTTQQGG